MASRKFRPNLAQTCLASLIGLAACSLSGGAMAVPTINAAGTLDGSIRTAVKFSPPPDTDKPVSVDPGGRRGCMLKSNADSKPTSNKSLTALIPPNRVALTSSKYPTFFLYVPETIDQEVEFILLDESEREVYKTRFKINGEPGILSISLPDSANFKPLQANKNYHWFFSLICNPNDRSGDVVVQEYIKRKELSPSLASQLERATPQQKVELLAEAGIWQDTLAELAQLRRENPKDAALAADWAKLLRSVGLDQVADEPLIVP